MSAARQCSRCGAALPEEVLEGLCPKCILCFSLDPADDAPPPAGPTGPFGTLISESPSSTSLPRLRYFGDYELLEEIARGGMGVVYKARQVSLNRTVAVKMILAGQMASAADVERFKREAQAAANLQHPNIVAIHEVGEHEGQHFFSMDYVEGKNLADVVRAGPLPAKRAAAYVKTIAEAIQYAHVRGTLHRDLKPSNVLIDANAQPRITDFGLAKRILAAEATKLASRESASKPGPWQREKAVAEHDAPSPGGDARGEGGRPSESESQTDQRLLTSAPTEHLTLSGQILGSPNFMPPEQAGGHRGDIGPHSDIYGLGAILYHLLTGRPPFVADTVHATLRLVCEAEPLSPHALNPGIPRDLETICLKCLEKDPHRRYQTAHALADELGRFLHGEPILARPVSRAEKLWRWCRRKPALATLSAAVTLVFLAGFAGVTWQWQRAEAHLYVADMQVAQQTWDAGSYARVKELVDAHRHQRPDLRGFEWRYLWRLCQGDDEFILGTHAHTPVGITFSPDGRTVATRSGDYILKVWDVATRQCRFMLSDVRWGGIFSSDGSGLLVGGREGVRSVDLLTGEVKPVLPQAGQLIALLVDGRTAVTTDTNDLVRLWDLPTGQERLRIPGAGGRNAKGGRLKVCVTPDGKRAAVIDSRGDYHYDDNGVTIWDVPSQTSVARLPDRRSLTLLRFSPDGRQLLVAGGYDGTLRLWELASTNTPSVLQAHSAFLEDAAFSPDGRLIATCASDQTIKLWRTASNALPRHLTTLRGHDGGVHAVCFSPDGARLASGGRDHTVRIWKLDRIQDIDATLDVFDDWTDYRPLFFLSDSKTLIGNCASGVKIWDAERMELQAIVPGPDVAWQLSADGKKMSTTATNAAGERLMRQWDLQSRTVVREWTAIGMIPFERIVASPNQQLVVLGNNRGVLQFWDASRWRELARRTNHTKLVRSLIFSRDSARMFSGADDGTIRIWELDTFQQVAGLVGTTEQVHSQALSPDESTLAAGSTDTRIYLWDWRRGKRLATLKGHRELVSSLGFSPDGKTLASGSSDGTVKLWNVALRREIATLKMNLGFGPLGDRIYFVGFSPDGNLLAARTFEGGLKVWRAPSFAEIEAAEQARSAQRAKLQQLEGKL